MKSHNMTQNNKIWFAVDEDGSEWWHEEKPARNGIQNGLWTTGGADWGKLFPGAIQAITGQTLTWESEPLEWVVGERDKQKTITDDAGNTWSKTCPNCGKDSMHVVRPGKVQCSKCD